MLKKILQKTMGAFGYEIHAIKQKPENGNNEKSLYFKSSKGDLDYFETPIGNYYLPNNAPLDVVINSMKKGVYFDQSIIRLADKYLKPGTAILDVGANFGQMSVYFSKIVGDQGKVYAFDADDYVFEIFKKTLDANGCRNVLPIFGAVYNVDNKIFHFPKQDFVRFGAYGSYGLAPNSDEGREVKSITIDSLNIQEPISFMKVDIQGSDLYALQGAEQTIRKNKMPIIFEFEQQFQQEFNTSFQGYVEFADRIGYKFDEIIDDINYVIVPK